MADRYEEKAREMFASALRGLATAGKTGSVMLLGHEARDTFAQAIAAALREQAAWRPIETAPKDGTPILAWMLWYPHGLQGREEYAERNFDILRWTDFNGGGWVHYVLGVPTHWRSIPAPPPDTGSAQIPSHETGAGR